MTEPTAPRPVPGPYRPGTGPAPTPVARPVAGQEAIPSDPRQETDGPHPPSQDTRPAAAPSGPGAPSAPEAPNADRWLAGLQGLPVSEHVAVFEAEHARLQRELGAIDPR